MGEISCPLPQERAILHVLNVKGKEMKDILGYEGLYSINELGEIRANARVIMNKHGKPQRYPECYLKQDVSSKGYARVTLCQNHNTQRKLVHRLVAETFIPNPENKPNVNHTDNNPRNNSVSNLEWCTHSENMLHAQKQDRLFTAQSKGGKTRGITGTTTDASNIGMVGNKFGCWNVTAFTGKRGRKYYFNATCTVCGNTAEREKSYLVSNKSLGCIKCN